MKQNNITSDTDSVPEMTLYYPDSVAYLKCSNCRIKKICPHFKAKFESLVEKSKDTVLPELKKINAEVYYNYLDKAEDKELVEQMFKDKLVDFLEENSDVCIYEQSAASQIYHDFETTYKISSKPSLKYYVYNIISQIILQLRLQRNVNMTDVIITKLRTSKDGSQYTIEVITPGLPYLMSLNDNILKSIAKFDQLVEGMKINIKGEMTVKDLMKKIWDIPCESKVIEDKTIQQDGNTNT